LPAVTVVGVLLERRNDAVMYRMDTGYV